MKTVQSIDEMNYVKLMTWVWGDRAWWVIESVSPTRPTRCSGYVQMVRDLGLAIQLF